MPKGLECPATNRRSPTATALVRHLSPVSQADEPRPAVQSVRTAIAWPMANDPPFATLNQFVADLGIPESRALRGLVFKPDASKGLTGPLCNQLLARSALGNLIAIGVEHKEANG